MAESTKFKVRGYHLDFYGHVNNARYLEFLEEARWQLLEGRIDLKQWQRENLALVVVRIEINYRSAAVLDDELVIASHMQHLGGRSGILNQEIKRVSDGQLIVDANVTFVVIDTRSGKSVPLDGSIRDAFEMDVL
jgi:thioesterase III